MSKVWSINQSNYNSQSVQQKKRYIIHAKLALDAESSLILTIEFRKNEK